MFHIPKMGAYEYFSRSLLGLRLFCCILYSFVCILRQGLYYVALAIWEPLCSLNWPQTHRVPPACLWSAGIKGMQHLTQLTNNAFGPERDQIVGYSTS